MPNHVMTDIELIGSEKDILALREFVKSESNPFDFNKVVQMPKELEDTRSPMIIISQEEYDKQEKENALLKEKIAKGLELTQDEQRKIDFGLSRCLTAELSAEYILKFGTDNWYDWNNINFGTKWNSYDHYCMESGTETQFGFQTAWSHPFPIIKKLSNLFPKVTINVKYADEDFGYNVGEYTIKGGKVKKENFPDGGTKEAYNLALDVQGGEDSYLYDVWEDEVDENTKILDGGYLEWCLELGIQRETLDADMPLFVLKTALKHCIKKEWYEKARNIENAIACVKE